MKTRLEIHDVESLKQRFPDMFCEDTVGFEFYKGWFPDFVDLCFELDALLREYRKSFYWIHLKEKFGGYRMSCHYQPPLRAAAMVEPGADGDAGNDLNDDEEFEALVSLVAEVRQRIRSAIQRINAKCCVCGDAAAATEHDSWMITLCGYHNVAAMKARGDQRPTHVVAAVPQTAADVPLWRTSP